MKTREVIFNSSTTLTLLDAYRNPRASIDVQKGEKISMPVPFKREVYIDTEGKSYYIYEGAGVLEHTDIALPYFVLNTEIVDGFDRFLTCSKCDDKTRDLFHSIYRILDLNMQKQDYIICPIITELENRIIQKTGAKSA